MGFAVLLTNDGQEAAELLVKALDIPTTDIRIDFGALGTATSAASQATSKGCTYVIAAQKLENDYWHI